VGRFEFRKFVFLKFMLCFQHQKLGSFVEKHFFGISSTVPNLLSGSETILACGVLTRNRYMRLSAASFLCWKTRLVAACTPAQEELSEQH